MPLKRIDTRAVNVAPDEILGFARVRNEALRLPWLLDFHRRLGVDRFFVVDNDSTDGSGDYLRSRPDVHLFATGDSYASNRSGMNWVNALLSEYAVDHWAVTVDADELLIYPGFEHLDLRGLAGYLDGSKVDALGCVMIDMYSATSIRATRYGRGEDFLKVCPYFDSESLVEMRGGPRKRLFWGETEVRGNPPVLWKIPLVRWRRGLVYAASTHLIDDVTPSEVSGALLHFKMFEDFHQRVQAAVEGRQFWEDSAQYEAYLQGLHKDPGLSAFYEGSVRFESSRQLVEMGFLRTSADYEAFLAGDRSGI